MYYNPRIDAFWRIWCREHPTFCPRAIHSDQGIPDQIQQHSGAFGHFDIDNKSLLPNPICHEPSNIKTGYKRFEGDEDNFPSEKPGYYFLTVFFLHKNYKPKDKSKIFFSSKIILNSLET